MPCIKNLPVSYKLSQEFNQVAFVYISLDRNFESWQKACKRHMRFDPAENYFIDELNKQRVNEEFDISYIPRYMLFDQHGQLIDLDAPKPNSKEIQEQFENYLKLSAVNTQ
jgi:hypothetical protein